MSLDAFNNKITHPLRNFFFFRSCEAENGGRQKDRVSTGEQQEACVLEITERVWGKGLQKASLRF